VKDIVDLLTKIGYIPVMAMGMLGWGLLAMSLYQPLAFVPKFFVLFVLTH
jgi:hypothetical protein